MKTLMLTVAILVISIQAKAAMQPCVKVVEAWGKRVASCKGLYSRPTSGFPGYTWAVDCGDSFKAFTIAPENIILRSSKGSNSEKSGQCHLDDGSIHNFIQTVKLKREGANNE